MTWEEYYDRYLDWAYSTQVSRISQITTFGDPSQIWEVAQNYLDVKSANRLIKKAVLNGVHFAGEQLTDMLYYVDTEIVNQALKSAALPLSEDIIWTLHGAVDDAILSEVAQKSGVSLDDEFVIEKPPVETPKQRRKRHREEFFEGAGMTMMMDIFIDDLFGKKK